MRTEYISNYIEFESDTELVNETSLDSFHKYILDLLLDKSSSYYFIISGDGARKLNYQAFNFIDSKMYNNRLLIVQGFYSSKIFYLLREAEKNECMFTIIFDKQIRSLDIVKNIENANDIDFSVEGYLKPLYKWLNYSEKIIIYIEHLLSYTCFSRDPIKIDIKHFDDFVINYHIKTIEVK